MYEHDNFVKLVGLLDDGVDSFDAFDEVCACMRAVNASVRGCFPPCRMKMTLEHLIASGLIPPRHVSQWPVRGGPAPTSPCWGLAAPPGMPPTSR